MAKSFADLQWVSPCGLKGHLHGLRGRRHLWGVCTRRCDCERTGTLEGRAVGGSSASGWSLGGVML